MRESMKLVLSLLLVSIFCVPWTSEFALETTSTSLPTIVPKHEVVNAVNSFGYKLMLKMMNENKNENVVISPTSIVGLLAMTLLGSAGKTYDEIANNLGFSQDIIKNRKTHEHLGELLNQLNSNVSSKTLYADAVFVDSNTNIRDLYRRFLNGVYHGDAHGTDFKQPEEAKNAINEWVKNHTEGKVDNFIKQTLPMSSKLVLLSALYFSGQWKQPFVPEYTKKMPFKKQTMNEVLADLMFNYGQFDYIFSENDDLHMIALPYNDTVTTLYALKPRIPKRLNLLELMERLDDTKIDALINQMTKKTCVVRFPKLELSSGVNLENTLKAMGLKSMFTPGEANFALMVDDNVIVNNTEDELEARIQRGETESRSLRDKVDSLPNPGIHVDSIIHDARMKIDEYGTEAVAATGAILSRTSEEFYADSPFYIFIRNEKTKLVTFSAVIFDPST